MALEVKQQQEEKAEDVSQQQQELSDLQVRQTKLVLSFAEKNYPKLVSNGGKQIKIDGMFYNITKINEAVEDKFAELERGLNEPTTDTKQARKYLYDFLTFATNITEDKLKEADRGELRNVALILTMMQKGFRESQ